MLLHGVEQGERKAQRTLCINNQKQLLLAHIMAVGDNNDRDQSPQIAVVSGSLECVTPGGLALQTRRSAAEAGTYYGRSTGFSYPVMRKAGGAYVAPSIGDANSLRPGGKYVGTPKVLPVT